MAKKKKVIFESDDVVATIEGDGELVDVLVEAQEEYYKEGSPVVFYKAGDEWSSEEKLLPIPVPLDEVREHELALDMCHRLKSIGTIKREMQEQNKAAKEEIGGHLSILEKARIIIEEGVETKEEVCEVVNNYTTGIGYVVQKETGVVVKEYRLGESERQMGLPGVEQGETKA